MAKKQTNKQKGYEWEQEFAEYMKEELGYKECIMNRTVTGKISTNEYEIDIIGKKLSKKGKSQEKYGVFLLITTIVIVVFEFFLEISYFGDDTLFVVAGLMFIGFILIQVAKSNQYEYSWVECKSHEKQIDKKVFQKLRLDSEDYHNSKDRKFNFVDRIIASKSGFTKNSLRFAEDYGIICYDKVGDKISLTDLKII